jgi:quercetin dioxygenase-like cupin family protein
MDIEQQTQFRAFHDYRWDEVACLPYKEDDAAPFKAISRQVLFAEAKLGCELRYFEMAAGGYSTLERHEHMHAVMILRGHGQCLVGVDVRQVKPFDLVTIPSMTWHQFRATDSEPLGFLCMVNAMRDRPQLPTEPELAALKTHPEIAAFLTSGP